MTVSLKKIKGEGQKCLDSHDHIDILERTPSKNDICKKMNETSLFYHVHDNVEIILLSHERGMKKNF